MVLTLEECEGLQWVWKQQWQPAEFAPEPTGRRLLGRPLGLHCSVEARTDREVQSRDNEPPAGQGITWLSPGREPVFLLQGRGIEIWNKVIPEVFLFNLKSAQPDSAPRQSSFSRRQMLCRLHTQHTGGLSGWPQAEWNWENATRPNKEEHKQRTLNRNSQSITLIRQYALKNKLLLLQ